MNVTEKLISFLVSVASIGAFGGTNCPLRTFKEVEDLSSKLQPIISISETENIPKLCQVNGYRDLSDYAFKDNVIHSGWPNSFIATQDFRENSFLKFFNPTLGSLQVSLDEKQRQEFYANTQQAIRDNPGVLPKSEKESILQGIKVLSTRSADQSTTINVHTSQAAFLCTDLSILKSLSCANGVKEMLDIARPVSGIALLPVWQEVISDPVYLKVFKNVALKIVDNLQNKKVPSTRMIDDLKNEFLKETNNKKLADDYAWNTMAIFSAGGGNANTRISVLKAFGKESADLDLQERNPISDLLWVLSNGSMALDRISADKGFLYTSPKGVENLCDYGKNYHFWMAAYLARQYQKKGGSPMSAASAAFTVEKGYQFASTGKGRYPEKPFSDPLYSNYNNNIRLDLTLAAAGAWYGATDSNVKQPTLQADQLNKAFQASFRNSKALERGKNVSKSDFTDIKVSKTLGLYSDWKKIINPDEAFQRFEKIYNP